MILKHVAVLLGAVVVGGMAVLPVPGATPGSRGAPGGAPAHIATSDPVLTPALKAALQELSAQEFEVREKAVADLEMALAQQMRAMVQVNDPEAQARINDLLTFEEGLCAWAKDVLKLPADQQKAAFDFGLQPEVLPHVARLYAKETSVRLDAVRALRKLPDPRVTDLLAHAIDDREQQVYVAAMEGVYDRPPTEAVADALWDRAVAAQFATFHPQAQVVPDRINFLDRQIPALNNGDNELYLRTQDNALATEVLVHLKPPQLMPRIKALFEDVEAAYSRQNPNGINGNAQNVWMYMPSQEAMRNAIQIAGAYQATSLVPGLYRIATGPALQKSQGQMNRQTYFWSNRTWAIALVLELSGQSPADWNLKTLNQLQGMWSVPTEADEAAAIVKLRQWWSKEHEKYGSGPDTRPAQDLVPGRPGARPPVLVVPLSQ